MITIKKPGAPTVDTIGQVGQHYINLVNGDEYECVKIDDKRVYEKNDVKANSFFSQKVLAGADCEYIWNLVKAGGGSGGGGAVELIENHTLFEHEFSWANDGFYHGPSIGLIPNERYEIYINGVMIEFVPQERETREEDGVPYYYYGERDIDLSKYGIPFDISNLTIDDRYTLRETVIVVRGGKFDDVNVHINVKIVGPYKKIDYVDADILPIANETTRGAMSRKEVRDMVLDHRSGFFLEPGYTTLGEVREYLHNITIPMFGIYDDAIEEEQYVYCSSVYTTNGALAGQTGGMYVLEIPTINHSLYQKIFLAFPRDENRQVSDDSVLDRYILITNHTVVLTNGGKRYKVTVDNSGNLKATEVTYTI